MTTNHIEQTFLNRPDQIRIDRRAAANSRLPQWGLTWLIQVQCFYQSLCLFDSEVLRNPPLRQAAKRCTQYIFRTAAERFAPIFSQEN